MVDAVVTELMDYCYRRIRRTTVWQCDMPVSGIEVDSPGLRNVSATEEVSNVVIVIVQVGKEEENVPCPTAGRGEAPQIHEDDRVRLCRHAQQILHLLIAI